MKVSLVAAVGVGLLVGIAYAQQEGAPKGGADLKDLRQKASYGLGLNLGRQLKTSSVDVDHEALARGIRDGLTGAQPPLADAEIQQAMEAFGKQVEAQQAQSAQAAAVKNKAAGEAFLAANKAKPGVVTLPSGLQYKVLKEGAGAGPKATDTVSVNYRGTLLDGTEFDSSYKRGTPATFPVNGVIAGWTEALQKMKPGAKWQLFIPSNLAYREEGRPGIEPNSTLLFEVELLKVQ